jgi:hypothetical protein
LEKQKMFPEESLPLDGVVASKVSMVQDGGMVQKEIKWDSKK